MIFSLIEAEGRGDLEGAGIPYKIESLRSVFEEMKRQMYQAPESLIKYFTDFNKKFSSNINTFFGKIQNA